MRDQLVAQFIKFRMCVPLHCLSERALSSWPNEVSFSSNRRWSGTIGWHNIRHCFFFPSQCYRSGLYGSLIKNLSHDTLSVERLLFRKVTIPKRVCGAGVGVSQPLQLTSRALVSSGFHLLQRIFIAFFIIRFSKSTASYSLGVFSSIAYCRVYFQVI